ncbi:MAG: hypothetical protein KDA61_09610 [Planctomycetales bacterium]|nr:hypothetical protein [Planctomycetales bacterium]
MRFVYVATCLFATATATAIAAEYSPPVAQYGPLVPGSGVKLALVGDDFEDPQWGYVLNGSKASHEQDEQTRPPGGRSRNGRWYESAKRGHPDVVKRVATPPGGPAGSRGAMYMATKYSGVPGELSGKQQQDDLLMSVKGRVGRAVPVAWQPSCVVRVYVPEFHRWERRSGSSFGLRGDVHGINREGEGESFWPGMFILHRPGNARSGQAPYAEIRIRAREDGHDVPGPRIESPGWWTFGIAFTPDGQVHHYAKPGLEDLTEADHLYSSFPYGFRCQAFDNFFFNVANLDNGQHWSTPWVVDNAEFFVVPPKGQTVANLLQRRSDSGTSQTAQRKSWFGKWHQ